MSDYPSKFDDHNNSANGVIMILACYMILEDQGIKSLCSFLIGNPTF